MARKTGIFALLLISVFSAAAYAITIGPSRLEVSFAPSEVGDIDYYVQNETDKPIHVTVEPENWYKDAYDYKNLTVDNWINLDTYEFDLEPKEIKKIKLTVTAPADIKGELVAQIFFSSDVTGAKNIPGSIKARLGAVLYVSIKGTEIIEAEIQYMNITQEVNPEGKKNLKIGVTMINNGNVHLRPKGKVSVENMTGEKLNELDLLEASSLLPMKQNIYYSVWKEPALQAGEYKLIAAVEYGKLFGVEKTATFEKIFKVNADGEVELK